MSNVNIGETNLARLSRQIEEQTQRWAPEEGPSRLQQLADNIRSAIAKDPDKMELAYQGAYRVSAPGLDEIFGVGEGGGLDRLLGGGDGIRSGQRIEWVEIETTMGAIPVARVHVVDPELRVVGYVAQAYAEGGEAHYIPWVVKVGYWWDDEENWASHTGYPAIESVNYPEEGPPTVTLTIVGAGIRLKRQDSSTVPKVSVKSRLHLTGNEDEPPSHIKALEEMARFYGCTPKLGDRVRSVLEKFDKQLEEEFDNATPTFQSWADARNLDTATVSTTDPALYAQWVDQYEQFRAREGLGPPRDTIAISAKTDWDYLIALRNEVLPVLNKDYPQGLMGVNDEHDLLTEVRSGGNAIEIGIRGTELIFCALYDLIKDIEYVPVFSYRCVDNSMLSWRGQTQQTKTTTSPFHNLIAMAFRRETPDGELDMEELEVSIGAFVEAMEQTYDITVTPEQVASVMGTYAFRLENQMFPAEKMRVLYETILGELNNNMQGQAKLLGFPWTRAGKLLGTWGLGMGPTNLPPTEEVKSKEDHQKIAHYNRFWQIHKCVHRFDHTGLYTTADVGGAASDDSAKKMEMVMKDIIEGDLSTITPGNVVTFRRHILNLFSF